MGGKIQIQISFHFTGKHLIEKKGITQVCSQGSKFDDIKTIGNCKDCPIVRHSLKKRVKVTQINGKWAGKFKFKYLSTLLGDIQQKKNLLFFGVRVSFSSICGRKNIWPQDARLS